jgi:hypothetical protein
MVAARHNLSCRAVLGAGAVASARGAGGALPSLSRCGLSREPAPQLMSEPPSAAAALHPRWHRALARFRRAEAALAAFRVEEALLPAWVRDGPHGERLEARYAALDGVRIAALRFLLKTPAPDRASLAFKIDLLFDEDVPSLPGAALCLAAVRADAHRLARHG